MLLRQLHPKPPLGFGGVLNADGSAKFTIIPAVYSQAKAYVIHYGNANQSDPHDATMMGYLEAVADGALEWTLSAENMPVLEDGDEIYFYAQAFNDVGEGANDIEKAAFLNENKLGSAWSKPAILTKGGTE